jgi:hypothetical protein
MNREVSTVKEFAELCGLVSDAVLAIRTYLNWKASNGSKREEKIFPEEDVVVHEEDVSKTFQEFEAAALKEGWKPMLMSAEQFEAIGKPFHVVGAVWLPMDKPLPLDTLPPKISRGMFRFFKLCPDSVRIGKIRDEIRERIKNTSVVTDRETEVRWILRKFRAAVPFLSMEELLLVSLEAQLPSPGLIGYPYHRNETAGNLFETYVKVAHSGKIEHMGIVADRYLNMCIESWKSLIQVLREVCQDCGINLDEVWGKERAKWYPQLFARLSSGELNWVEMREKQREILDCAARERYSNPAAFSERMEAFDRYEEQLKIFDDIMIFLDNHKVRPFFWDGWLYECFALPVPTRPDERPKTTAASEEREEQATQAKSEQPPAVGGVGENGAAVPEEEKEREAITPTDMETVLSLCGEGVTEEDVRKLLRGDHRPKPLKRKKGVTSLFILETMSPIIKSGKYQAYNSCLSNGRWEDKCFADFLAMAFGGSVGTYQNYLSKPSTRKSRGK